MPSAEIKQIICSLILATDNTFHHSLLRDFTEIDTHTRQRVFAEDEKEVTLTEAGSADFDACGRHREWGLDL